MSLRIPGEHYGNVRDILIYPSTFVPRPACKRLVWMGTKDEKPEADLGQTWADGDMVLSWDSVKAGAAGPRDGQNVVYHEFAHLLADEHDLDPTRAKVPQLFGPPIQWQPDVPNPDEWNRVLSARRECHAREPRRSETLHPGTPDVLPPLRRRRRRFPRRQRFPKRATASASPFPLTAIRTSDAPH
jgi:Mlc titration factor MtfA (ptsG expression regulator)